VPSPATTPTPNYVQRLYLSLTVISTLAASFIWGINTLFLLDAGLSNTQAFLANALFTVGQMLFEIPTGVLADLKGRRASYLLGTLTLALSTLAYLAAWQFQAPFWAWALASALIGLGFTFFSGATEAWLVDALNFSKYTGELDSIFAKGQSLSGASMLIGTIFGGWIAQTTNLGVPFILRAIFLFATFLVAYLFMRDWGWQPKKSVSLGQDIRNLFTTSFEIGFRKPEIRWVMLAAPFTTGVSFFVFYAMQPHLLNLYGDPKAYSVAGLAAAIVAVAQIIGGLLTPQLRKLFPKRSWALFLGAFLNALLLLGLSLTTNFYLAISLISAWAMTFAATMPIRQSYLNLRIKPDHRATVLSFEALLGSSGGVVFQPLLGRVADFGGYLQSYMVGSGIYALSLPFLFRAHRNARAIKK
jgi:MFS family permease